jgi:hypothetical protein
VEERLAVDYRTAEWRQNSRSNKLVRLHRVEDVIFQ